MDTRPCSTTTTITTTTTRSPTTTSSHPHHHHHHHHQKEAKQSHQSFPAAEVGEYSYPRTDHQAHQQYTVDQHHLKDHYKTYLNQQQQKSQKYYPVRIPRSEENIGSYSSSSGTGPRTKHRKDKNSEQSRPFISAADNKTIEDLAKFGDESSFLPIDKLQTHRKSQMSPLSIFGKPKGLSSPPSDYKYEITQPAMGGFIYPSINLGPATIKERQRKHKVKDSQPESLQAQFSHSSKHPNSKSTAKLSQCSGHRKNKNQHLGCSNNGKDNNNHGSSLSRSSAVGGICGGCCGSSDKIYVNSESAREIVRQTCKSLHRSCDVEDSNQYSKLDSSRNNISVCYDDIVERRLSPTASFISSSGPNSVSDVQLVSCHPATQSCHNSTDYSEFQEHQQDEYDEEYQCQAQHFQPVNFSKPEYQDIGDSSSSSSSDSPSPYSHTNLRHSSSSVSFQDSYCASKCTNVITSFSDLSLSSSYPSSSQISSSNTKFDSTKYRSSNSHFCHSERETLLPHSSSTVISNTNSDITSRQQHRQHREEELVGIYSSSSADLDPARSSNTDGRNSSFPPSENIHIGSYDKDII